MGAPIDQRNTGWADCSIFLCFGIPFERREHSPD
jgi:hypothetical protein